MKHSIAVNAAFRVVGHNFAHSRTHRKTAVKHPNLETMPLEDLWNLHTEITSVLASKIEAQKAEIDRRLAELGCRFGGSPRDIPQPRPYPAVVPKFRNPDVFSETWSGRGKQPRWVVELLVSGASLDECRIQ